MLKDLFYILYGGVAVLNMIACLYLLFRRSNAIAPDITSPVRLRRWTAAFFAASALSHLWNLPVFFLTSSDDVMLSYLLGALLDCTTVGPLSIVILFVMMQDRRRPLWPVFVMVSPAVIIMGLAIATRNDAILLILYAYVILLFIGLVIYMLHEVRQYGRWLRDNYADLAHKEIWQTFVVLIVVLLVLGVYTYAIEGMAYEYFIQVIDVLFVCYLLWRVETLSDLSLSVNDANDETVTTETVETNDLSPSIRNSIAPLLKLYCEEQQLYLQYDISITQLAKQIGINRTYLSNHFAMQGITYNTYINDLRIRHFINLYHAATASHQPVTAQQLAYQSGFRSYSTFGLAFKQQMGMTAKDWMRLSES